MGNQASEAGATKMSSHSKGQCDKGESERVEGVVTSDQRPQTTNELTARADQGGTERNNKTQHTSDGFSDASATNTTTRTNNRENAREDRARTRETSHNHTSHKIIEFRT